MALVTRRPQFPVWEPFADLEMFPGIMRRMFEGVEPLPALKDRMGWIPTVDIAETDEELVLTAELPGMTTKDIKVRVENGVLTLQGEKKEEKTQADDKRRYHMFERFYGNFTRAFALPRAVVPEKVTAAFEHGILTIRLPKMPEAKGHLVEVVEK
jgi:HSP20 family protein